MKIKTTVNSQIKEKILVSLIKKTLAQAGLFFDKDKMQAEVAVILIDDKGMRKLNKKYRHKDKVTNVLSFPTAVGLKLEKEGNDLGDIFICWPEAKREAKKYGLSLKQELNRLLVHGFLHLLGYKHDGNAKKARQMEYIEAMILKLIQNAKLKSQNHNVKP